MGRIRNIDGLRAIAVLAVIFFHAGFPGVDGGYIGVDIFFVISGYVITKSIFSKRAANTFSILGFYESRIRRLFPSLAIVCLTTFFLSFLLTPSDFFDISKSLFSVISGTANVYFWKSTNYFTKPGQYIPFLHTWSLSLEEQFYLLFPVIFLILLRFRTSWRQVVLLTTALLSLLLAILLLNVGPLFSFYMLPTRAWELLIGVVVAEWSQHEKLKARDSLVSRTLTLVAIGVVLLSIHYFDSTISSPNLLTVVPCLATAYLISAGSENAVSNRLLGNKALVYVGTISYSLYLWHQPIYSFIRLHSATEPHVLLFLPLILLSGVLAHLSHFYIESRFKAESPRRIERGRVFVIWATVTALILALGAAGVLTHGFDSRLSNAERGIFKVKTVGNPRADSMWRKCFLAGDQNYSSFLPSCFSGATKSQQTFILGDSHSAMIASYLHLTYPTVSEMSASACPPIVEIVSPVRKFCAQNAAFYVEKIKEYQPAQVVLMANWFAYGTHFLNQRANNFDLLAKTIQEMKLASPDTKIYLVGSMPEWYPDLPTALVRIRDTGKRVNIPTPLWKDLEGLNQQVKRVARIEKVHFVDLLDHFCRPNMCTALVKDEKGVLTPLVFDYGHLTPAGVEAVVSAPEFAEILTGIARGAVKE